MQYHGASYASGVWDIYWYEKNLFGDIVAVYDHSGTKRVSYIYDAWGNFTTAYHNGTTSSSQVAKNPFRYRGYYYDKDLELYYLQTRYYDSNTGRFINADGVHYLGENGDINSYNLFAYCSNNPVMFVDPSGCLFFGILATFVIGGLALAGVSYVKDVCDEIVSDGFQWSDLGTPLRDNLDDYAIDFLEGVVITAVWKYGLGKIGTNFPSSSGAAGKLSFVFFASSAAGFGIYSLDTLVFENGEFDFYEMLEEGFGLGFKSLKYYNAGRIANYLGFAPKKYVKVKEAIVRRILIIPMDLIEDAIKEGR